MSLSVTTTLIGDLGLSQKPKTAETDRYRYSVERAEIEGVLLVAVPLTGDGATEEDVGRVKEELRDLGKWEALVCSISDLLQGVGFNASRGYVTDYAFGYERYGIEVKGDRGYISVIVVLSKEERRKRQSPFLSGDEIIRQVGNISRWRNLRRSFSFLEQAP